MESLLGFWIGSHAFSRRSTQSFFGRTYRVFSVRYFVKGMPYTLENFTDEILAFFRNVYAVLIAQSHKCSYIIKVRAKINCSIARYEQTETIKKFPN